MFYDKFQALCKIRGISISRAATEIGLSNSTPTKWKKTKATPDSSTLEKISAYFQVPINLLLSDPANDKPISFTTTVEELREYIDTKKAPAPEGELTSINNHDIRRIARAHKKMPKQDKERMLTILENAFPDYFSDDYVDEDTDE